MKYVNMRKRDIKQFYVLPTFIISKNHIGRRYFLCWLYWTVEFNNTKNK